MLFIDYKNAYNKVNRNRLFENIVKLKILKVEEAQFL